MGQIAVLPQTLINQIAAGEVIVRPASVVKELVENSLDAGATRITILVGGDAQSITVIDDGCGMDREDAELALQRHATSKIQTTDDLSRIQTRGFRGEAVPSIASVARVEILTRPADALAGTRVIVEGGRIEEIQSAGCPPGTRFEVRDLFYNTPARLKFLKSPRVEIHALMQVVTHQALSRPEVGWLVEVDGEKALEVPSGQRLIERARQLWGSAVGEGLFEVAGQRHDIEVAGVLGLPRVARRDRRWQVFFVNRRPILSRTLSAALVEAYRGLLMVNRHPVAALFLAIDHPLVDVNVHPTKEEVRFRDERGVAGSLFRIVSDGLRGAQLVPMLTLGSEPGAVDTMGTDSLRDARPEPTHGVPGIPSPAPQAGVPAFFHSPEMLARPGGMGKRSAPSPPDRRSEQIDWFGTARAFDTAGPGSTPGDSATGAKEPRAGSTGDESALATGLEVPATESVAPDRSGSPETTLNDAVSLRRAEEGGNQEAAWCDGPPKTRLTEPASSSSLWNRFGDPEPLGQIDRTYVVAAFGEGMLLVDQHAAHERLLFLHLQQQDRPRFVQHLLIPLTVEIAPADVPQLQAIQPVLRDLGIEVEEFGGTTFSIHTLPGDLEGLDVAGLIQDLLESASRERGRREPVRELRDRVLARMACRAAVKAGQRLAPEEMRRLLADLRRHRMAFTCPHGRPTMTYLSRRELDKQFKRIL